LHIPKDWGRLSFNKKWRLSFISIKIEVVYQLQIKLRLFSNLVITPLCIVTWLNFAHSQIFHC
jgi:hypothetical protein